MHRRYIILLVLSIAVLLVTAVAISAQGYDYDSSSESVTVNISADNIAFNKDRLEVPAGAKVTLVFENKENVPHNVAIYESEAISTTIFQGEVFNGPKTVEYEFTAPSKPGDYYFICDVHPKTMTGTFAVTES